MPEPVDPTSRLALSKVPTDHATVHPSVLAQAINDNANKLDTAAIILHGLASARPPAGISDRFYFATDTGELTRDSGIVWGDPFAYKTDSRFTDHAVLSAAPILDVGVSGQKRAGRALAVADFTTLCGLPTTPVLLATPGSLTNLGSGGNLVNKGTVPLTAKDILAGANAYLFAGSTGQALYIADTGGADPFRIKTGSWGCWLRAAKRGASESVMGKIASPQSTYGLFIDSSNAVRAYGELAGADNTWAQGVTDVRDDRWHFAVATHDGSVLRIYVDGTLDGSLALAGPLFGGSAPFNVGAFSADGATVAASPFFGRVYQPFVTADVLSDDQIRLLMCASIPHGFGATPSSFTLGVRRKRKGAAWATGDFSATPKHLYAGGSLTDLGSLANNLTANGAPVTAAGADGSPNGAYIFKNASSQYLSAPITGLPSGTSARSAVLWVKTLDTNTGRGILTQEGGTGGTDFRWFYMASGVLRSFDGTNTLSGVFIADGAWHMLGLVIDNAAADGQKRKLYVDGKLIISDASLASTTLGTGSAQLVVAREAGSDYLDGSVGPWAITDYAMGEDEMLSLYAKGAQALAAVPLLDDADPRQCVQGADATNVYLLGDVRKKISGRVNSDGTIAAAAGGDFRVVKGATGHYFIYFPAGFFSAPPSVLATSGVGNDIVIAQTISASSVDLGITAGASGTGVDVAFSFTAEGRGPIPSQHALDLKVAS